MDFEIVEVTTKADLLRFIKSQFEFYRGDRNFVPPIIGERAEVLDEKKNPFFAHSRMKLFLARSGGRVVGRIASIINGNHLETYDDNVGFFGFFECIDDQRVANALFDKAADWLRENGLKAMRGPANPSLNDDAGLLFEGFDTPPVFMMPYNPPYYNQLCENYGFVKEMDLFAYHLNQKDYMSEKMQRLYDVVMRRYDVKIRNVSFRDKKQFPKDVEIMKDIYNQAWEKNWGFVKMTDDEFNHLAKSLKLVTSDKLVFFVEVKGAPVGFALGLPDQNQCLIHNRKGSMLGALWQMTTKKSRVNLVRIIVLGLLPEYRKTGLDAVLFHEIATRGFSMGLVNGEASFIVESNTMMNRAATNTLNGKLYKKYRLYEKEI